MECLFNQVPGLKTFYFIKGRLQHKCFPVKFVKFLRTPFFYRTHAVAASGNMSFNFLFIAYENNKWCHFVVSIGSPAFIYVYFVSFYFFVSFFFFLFFCGFYYLLRFWGKFFNIQNKAMELFLCS